jgi:hypothetical protein
LRQRTALIAGTAWPTERLSLLSAFEAEGRKWYFTTEHFIVPADRMRPARLFEFHGVELAKTGEPGEHLPLVWVNAKPATLYKLVGEELEETNEALPAQGHAMITAQERFRHRLKYLELTAPAPGASDPKASYWVRAGEVTRVDPITEPPAPIKAEDKWIDVRIDGQVLVMYDAMKPIFTTLVSTGLDGLAGGRNRRSTPQGVFRILSKHITARMRAEEKPPEVAGDKPDPRYRVDDVPYVQFFHAGYALHGAYWHDSFGQARSHGCINLSPLDAVWMFKHTTPDVPEGWHGVLAEQGKHANGTWVSVHVF